MDISALRVQLLPDRIQHAVDEFDGVLGAERTRQLQRLVDDHGMRQVFASACRVSCATTSAISIAATAASRPLLDGPSPARASASSTEFVVSTPNAIGTPVAAEPAASPCATAEQM